MKFFRLDLLTLLISLFILGSCKNDDTIGLPPGDQQLNGTLVVDENVVVNTVPEDPIITTGVAKAPLASFNDNAIGLTTSSVVSAINLPGNSTYTKPTGTIITDSAVLELRYAAGFYGDSVTSQYKVSAYRLSDETPSSSQPYLSTKVWAHAATPIGSTQAFNARPGTPVKVNEFRKGRADTIRQAAAHIRVPISTAFINESFFNAPASQLASPALFTNAIKGLYIKVDRNQPQQAGGALMLNMDSCRINVYYRTNTDGVLDTAVVSLPFGQGTYASEIKHTYTTQVEQALKSTTQSNETFYLQGGGLRAKVSFPNLQDLFGADYNKVALNRAELVITPEPNSTIPFAPLPQLTMYQSDIAGQRLRLPDANGSSQGALDPYYFSTAIFGGLYDNTKQQYRFVITGYIQNLLNKKTIDYGTYIAPIDVFVPSASIPIASTISTSARTIAVGSKANSPYRIKLNIIYTK